MHERRNRGAAARRALAVLAAGLLAGALPAPVTAGQQEAEDAMSAILFDSEDIRPEEVVYTVTPKGVVNVTLDDGVPEELADRFVDRLRSHPDISGANINSADICVDIKR